MSHLFVPVEKADLEWKDDLPFSRNFQDIYFSQENGLAESHHVFIEGNQLIDRWKLLPENKESHFVIAETGFGSGLNFFLSCALWLQHAPEKATLTYLSCEKFPLAKEDLQKSLALWPELAAISQQFLALYPVLTPGFHPVKLANGRIRLTLMLGDAIECYKELLACGDYELEKTLGRPAVDAWFLDGFAPAKNESMWRMALFQIISLLSKQGTTLATFSAAKVVRENLAATGFCFSREKGFSRKKQMIKARFQGEAAIQYRQKQTPWHVALQREVKHKKAIIVGAGLAGCFTAYSLAQRGWQVVLLDEQSQVAMGASAVSQGVLFPKLSAYRSPLTEFLLMSYLYSSAFYKKISQNTGFCQLNGALLLAYNEKEAATQAALRAWLDYYPELGRLVNESQASQLAGIPLSFSGLHIPDSGWIDSAALCRWLINHFGIDYYPNTGVEGLYYEHGNWTVANHQAEIVILANGYRASQFKQSEWLPLKPIRGQMTAIEATLPSNALALPLCASGHVLPAVNGMHWLGASYDLGQNHNGLKKTDDKDNLNQLKQFASQLIWSENILGSWAAVRASTADYLPLVGPVTDAADFNRRYAKFSANARQWIPDSQQAYPGLFVCAGFGSRGLSTIPLAAEYLAAELNHEPGILPRSLIQAISPARFLKKKLDRTRQS